MATLQVRINGDLVDKQYTLDRSRVSYKELIELRRKYDKRTYMKINAVDTAGNGTMIVDYAEWQYGQEDACLQYALKVFGVTETLDQIISEVDELIEESNAVDFLSRTMLTKSTTLPQTNTSK